jgi:RNA polymerase sigma-70 factor, ECF subfamily
MKGMGLLSPRKIVPAAASSPPNVSEPCPAVPEFETVYQENLKFVWRAARRLGIDPGDTDDVVQEVFVVAHRRLPEFEGRAQIKTWLLKILVRVVRQYFRTRQRKPGHRPAPSLDDLDRLHDNTCGPAEAAERKDAVRILDSLLDRLDCEKREVFVLAEVEQLSSVEIAEVLGANINTVYSRLRAARQEFQQALGRFHTHELGGTP